MQQIICALQYSASSKGIKSPTSSLSLGQFRPEVSKNSSTALSSNEGELARSITTCAPATASLTPSLVMAIGRAATASWPPCSGWRRSRADQVGAADDDDLHGLASLVRRLTAIAPPCSPTTKFRALCAPREEVISGGGHQLPPPLPTVLSLP